MHRPASALALFLAACSAEPPAPVREPAPVSTGETADGLAFVDAAGVERLRLVCGPGDRLGIAVPGFRPIASEDRLTLGAGDEAFAHVADLAAPGPGVSGSGPIDRELVDRLARGQPLRAVYGAQSVGPLQAARPGLLTAFANHCLDPRDP